MPKVIKKCSKPKKRMLAKYLTKKSPEKPPKSSVKSPKSPSKGQPSEVRVKVCLHNTKTKESGRI